MNLYLFRLDIMKELVKRGDEVYAISPVGLYSDRFRDDGIKHISYDIDRESLNPFKERRSVDNIYHALKDLNLDMLHTFTAKPNIYGTFAEGVSFEVCSRWVS
jgi:N,N'-diacetylbacillosaminyl-diphospho-undecaprenol alpha-1,3-N-acetylgalactosaminyltransferase